MTTTMIFHLDTLFPGGFAPAPHPFRLLYRYIGVGNMIMVGCYFAIFRSLLQIDRDTYTSAPDQYLSFQDPVLHDLVSPPNPSG